MVSYSCVVYIYMCVKIGEMNYITSCVLDAQRVHRRPSNSTFFIDVLAKNEV